jgi:hypothetical protein
VYNPAPWFCGRIVISQFQALGGRMSETREDHSASRVATLFVFIFLVAAIIETSIATFGR